MYYFAAIMAAAVMVLRPCGAAADPPADQGAASTSRGLPPTGDVIAGIQSDVAALKSEVADLSSEQDLIVAQLQALKQLLANPPQVGAETPQSTALKVEGLPFTGDKTARAAIVEVSDFECPVCRKYAKTVYPQLAHDYVEAGKIRYYYYAYPLSIHVHAMPAAVAARCAADQGKFWEMHDSLFADPLAVSTQDLVDRAKSAGLDVASFSACLSSGGKEADIQSGIDQGRKFGVRATPTFFVGKISSDGTVLDVDTQLIGDQSFNSIKAAVDDELSSVAAACADQAGSQAAVACKQ